MNAMAPIPTRRAFALGSVAAVAATTIAAPATRSIGPIEAAWREHDRRCGLVNTPGHVADEHAHDFAREPLLAVEDWTPATTREFAALVLLAESEGDGSALRCGLIEVAHEALG